MKALLKAFSAVALIGLALPAMADDSKEVKDLKKQLENQSINYVQTAQKGIVLSGYVDTSYTYQFGNGGYGPNQTTTNALRQFDTNNNNFNVNAVKIALTKALTSENTWQAGFRIDTIYGSDAKYLGDFSFNSFGSAGSSSSLNNTSGLALEQAYVNFNIPVGNGLQVQVGKFVTPLGYEVIESPANLNYSRGLLFTNAIPLTHTGVLASYTFNNIVSAKFGIVDGWNSSVSPQYNSSNDTNSFGKAFLGQVTLTNPGGNATLAQSFIASPEGDAAATSNGALRNAGFLGVYDIVGNWTPTFVPNNALLLGFNADLGYNSAAGYAFSNTAQSESQLWEGLALYAQYKFSPKFNLAARGEVLHEDGAANPKFGNASVDNLDFSETITGTFNIWDNLLTRVEYRLDVLNPAQRGTGSYFTPQGSPSGGHRFQNEISLNAVYSF